MGLTETLFDIDKVVIFSEAAGIVIEVDAAIHEEHKSEAEVTAHPVEQGAAISDHIRRKPRELSLNGIVSNTPLHDLLSLDRFDTGGRAEVAWENLLLLQASATKPNATFKETPLVTIITTLATYENMALVSLSCPRDAQRGNVVEFTAMFREIFTVASEAIAVPETPRPPKKALGNAAAGKATATARGSLLSKLPAAIAGVL